MAFDVQKHQFVPKHTKLSDSEKKELLEKYSADIHSFPKIMKDDPAITRLNVKGGDIIKIERDSKTALVSAYYRVVVE